MLSRLIAIMVAMSFVIIPAYAEETAAAAETEAPAVAKQDKPTKVNLLDELQQAYEKNDREAMGKIIEQMQQRREKMRQKRAELREGRKNRRMNTRRGGQVQAGFRRGQSQGEPRQAEFGTAQQQNYRQMGPWQGPNQEWGWNRGSGQFQGGQGQAGFGPSQRRGRRQMGPWQGTNQGWGQWNIGPRYLQRGVCGRDSWGCQKGFGWGPRAGRWHHGGGRFEQGCCGWNRPRCGHGERRFGHGEGWHKGFDRGCCGQCKEGSYEREPGCKLQGCPDTNTDCEREAGCKQRSEWDW